MSSIIGSNETQIHPTTEEEASCMAMCLATWSVPSMVFKTMLELNVIDIIYNSGPTAQLSAEEIVAKLPATNPHAAVVLDRMLRLLASFTILTCTQQVGPDGQPKRLYGLGPVCQFLAKNDDEVSYAAYANLMHDKIIMDTWKHLKDAVLEGSVPFKKTYGTGIYDYLGTDSRFYRVFYDGMDHHSTIVLKKILETYKGFEGISTLVDVGGGSGVTLKMIVSKYPSIKAINFDQPHIIKDAPSYPGVEHVGGDMYASVPKADAIFMKWTFQSGTDEQCVKLLKNFHEALPEDGKVVICEYLVPDSPKTSYQAHTAFIWDIIMMTYPGGKARTKQEYEALGKEAGFEDFRLVCFACDTWVMEYLKKKKSGN
ncbi:caffeic acid 3-O-methyltransferase [Spinacia oleracea]|uniref:Caffeic acid 3-O-methyltransferase n=1 Tax=Spinacia oleracea TaxID=3562 RepID=A0A9R0I7M5_SPIOL|nr:caffeic acid 3-O-methyltransferase-like [Spinacia oleracea]